MWTVKAHAREYSGHEFILSNLKRALLNKEFNLITIVATRSLMNHLQEKLLQDGAITGVGGVRFYLFDGFMEEICGLFGLNERRISLLEKNLLLEKLFRELIKVGQIRYLNHVPLGLNYRQAILEGIAEWQRSGLTPSIFSEWATEQSLKEQELALLYQAYETELTARGFTEDYLIIEKLRQIRLQTSEFPEKTKVLLYGFTDLTPLQQDLLQVLNLWFDFEIIIDPTEVPEFTELLQKHFSFRLATRVSQREVNTALPKLQSFLWREPGRAQKIAPEDDSLVLIQAAGPKRQALAIAREIKRLIQSQEGSLDLGELLILVPDRSQFLKIAAPIFREYQLPLAEDKICIGQLPTITYFSQLLQVVINGWRFSDLAWLLREAYHLEEPGAGDLVVKILGENYGAISGRQRFQNLLKESQTAALFEKWGLKITVFARVIRWLDEIATEASLKNYLSFTKYWFSQKQTLPTGEITPGETLVFQRQLLNQRAVLVMQELVTELLKQETEIPGMHEKRSLAAYLTFCEEYLFNQEIEIPCCAESPLRVLPLREARGLTTEIVFITGLVQGICPRSYVQDWKLGPLARLELKGLGIEMETGEDYHSQEKLNFYYALQVAQKKLFLVTQDQNDEGQPVHLSSYLRDILQWFPDLLARARQFSLAPELPAPLAECFNETEREGYFFKHFFASHPKEGRSQKQECLQLLYSDLKYHHLAREALDWLGRSNWAGQTFLTKPAVFRVLEEYFHPGKSWAVTLLEDYRACPYRFFFKHLLRVRPQLPPALRPGGPDLGNFYHEVLREFGESLRDQQLAASKTEEYQAALQTIFTAHFQKWQEQAATDLDHLVLDFQRQQLEGRLLNWLAKELEWSAFTRERFTIAFLELAFGIATDNSDAASVGEAFSLKEGEEEVLFWGKIDRVDRDEAGNFIVYDYKLNRGPATKDILELNYLQLPLYLLALESLLLGKDKGLGGGYLGLKKPSRISGSLWRSRGMAYDLPPQIMLSERAWQEWLDQVKKEVMATVQAIRAGDFRPQGNKCVGYCEYQTGCRRSEWEVGKEG